MCVFCSKCVLTYIVRVNINAHTYGKPRRTRAMRLTSELYRNTRGLLSRSATIYNTLCNDFNRRIKPECARFMPSDTHTHTQPHNAQNFRRHQSPCAPGSRKTIALRVYIARSLFSWCALPQSLKNYTGGIVYRNLRKRCLLKIPIPNKCECQFNQIESAISAIVCKTLVNAHQICMISPAWILHLDLYDCKCICGISPVYGTQTNI